MIFHVACLVVLSVASLGFVWRILRAADRLSFPSTFVPMRAPEVLDLIDTYSPLDHRGLV